MTPTPEGLRLSSVLGLPVREVSGTRLGYVCDVRFQGVASGPRGRGGLVAVGLLVAGRPRQSRWGYDRRGDLGPAAVGTVVRALVHRRTGYVPWVDVVDLTPDGVVVRSG